MFAVLGDTATHTTPRTQPLPPLPLPLSFGRSWGCPGWQQQWRGLVRPLRALLHTKSLPGLDGLCGRGCAVRRGRQQCAAQRWAAVAQPESVRGSDRAPQSSCHCRGSTETSCETEHVQTLFQSCASQAACKARVPRALNFKVQDKVTHAKSSSLNFPAILQLIVLGHLLHQRSLGDLLRHSRSRLLSVLQRLELLGLGIQLVQLCERLDDLAHLA